MFTKLGELNLALHQLFVFAGVVVCALALGATQLDQVFTKFGVGHRGKGENRLWFIGDSLWWGAGRKNRNKNNGNSIPYSLVLASAERSNLKMSRPRRVKRGALTTSGSIAGKSSPRKDLLRSPCTESSRP